MDGLFPLNEVAGEQLSRATISACGTYRYTLDRVWDASLPAALFVMLNPSTASATEDDPTIRRCKAFADRAGCGALTVVNLFALRSTKPGLLALHSAPTGPDNDAWITVALANQPSLVVAAWGAYPAAAGRRIQAAADGRAARVMQLLAAHDVPAKCLGTTKDGYPRHPLYVAGAQPLIDFTSWKAAV
jgi:hypothetical protein